MSQNFADYVKDLWAHLFKSEEIQGNYDAERKKLEEYLNEMDGLPTATELPEVPVYNRMEVESVSDEELKKRAEDELHDYYGSTVKSIDSSAEEGAKKYEADKVSAEKAAAEKTAALEQTYAQAKENASNDSLKRGLARSSIALNHQYALNEGEAKAAAAVKAGLSDRIAELDGEIGALALKRENALNDFNIAYAAKLTTLINSLKDELDKKKTEALKYNNTLTEKEYSSTVSKTEKESDLYSEALSQKQKENDLKKEQSTDYEKKFEVMKNLLSSLTEKQAREAVLNDPIFKDNLTDYYYYKLYEEFCRP